MEMLQKRALQIMQPNLSYADALVDLDTTSLYERRKGLSNALFDQIVRDQSHKLLSTLELTRSENDLLQRGLNFCPTPPPPKPESVNKDVDAFARRLNLREYHAPNEIDEMENQSAYKPSILEKLNKKEWVQHYRPSREPYINSYVERQDIKEEISCHNRFQRNNLNKHERKALMRLRDK